MMTKPEVALWQVLRQRPKSLKVRRQQAIGPHIIFCCLDRRLVVEVDGALHGMDTQPQRDVERDRFITENGYGVLRVSAARVLADVEEAAAAIVARAENPLHRASHGPPPRTGEDS